MRGRIRFLLIRHQLPAYPKPFAVSVHLPEGLCQLMADCYEEHLHLIDSYHAISKVLIVDPDAPLGYIRDFRYRVAIFTASIAAHRWLQLVESLDSQNRYILDSLGCNLEFFTQLAAHLQTQVGITTKARALEPFQVQDVQHAQQTLDQFIHELACVENRLGQYAPSPYRS